MHRRLTLGVMALAAVFAEAAPSIAAGAIAVGRPANVAKQGISMGFSTNRSTVEEARSRAMTLCRDSGTFASSALCEVVATFENQCVAVAIDPKVGTPGFGWAVADTEREAKNKALSNCRETAGPTRGAACNISDSYCDASAKGNSNK